MTLDATIARPRGSGRNGKGARPQAVRCAIYCRKSTAAGLDQEFNSIDNQREACAAFITSQHSQGWTTVGTYEDGGFSGGNMDRPGLDRLLADIKAGRINAVVCYRVDRLSRSVLDFSRIMAELNKHDVAFVSVTEYFNTATPAGRMMLNMITTFAQYEREVAVERVRDKVRAARRRGKWTGGNPPFGYDAVDGKLVVNKGETARVRAIFEMYIREGSLQGTACELNQRGWRTKEWRTQKGYRRGGGEWSKTSLQRLLTNPVYIGKVIVGDDVYDGEHDAIVDEDLCRRAHALLDRNGNGGSEARNKWNALLRGLLYCQHCGTAMRHTYTTVGNRRYRYYRCAGATANGAGSCPGPSVSAPKIEQHVVGQIAAIGRDPDLVAQTLDEVRHLQAEQLAEAKQELATLDREAAQVTAESRRLLDVLPPAGHGRTEALKRLAELDERARGLEARRGELSARVAELEAMAVDPDDLTHALAEFDGIWAALTTREQIRVIELLVERIDYDGAAGSVVVSFKPTGITTLARGAAT